MAEIAGDETPPLPSSSGAGESSLYSSPPSPTAPAGDQPPPPRTTKPGTKRLVLTASVFLSFLVGLPFLLKSTEIHRSPLPSDAIADLSRRLHSHPPSFPRGLHAVFLRSGPGSPASSLADQLERAIIPTQPHGLAAGNISVSVTVQSDGTCSSSSSTAAPPWRCGAVTTADSVRGDEVFDELLHSALGGGGGGDRMKVYTVVFIESDDEKGTTVVIGKHRHAWVAGKVDEAEAVSLVGKVFIKYFLNGGVEEGEAGIGKGEFMPVGSDGNVVLSFSLLNADPNDRVYDWDFENIGERMLNPVVEALRPIADINVESQVLYHTPKSSFSHSDDKLGGNVLSMGDIPFFVNSNEWHLDTSLSATGRSKVLQFVVYVPSARECPLYLQLPDGELSKTNAFISPMWGGVVIWNPPGCSHGSKTSGTQTKMSSQELMETLEIFIGQLRQLFGLKANYHAQGMDVTTKFLVSEKGFAQWELDLLYRHHACSNLLSCLATLESLSSLVQSLPRMIVMDEIGRQVELSLEAASLAQRNATLGISDSSAVSATRARALAEDAFFHPSISSISYASVEHYFAIYMPFFAPVTLHVLLAAIKELKRYKVERGKYSAFLASQAMTS